MKLATLSEYAKHKDGTYVALNMCQQSMDLLDHFVANNLGLEERVTKNSYHITVIYSRTPVPDAEKLSRAHNVQANSVGYEMFDTKDGGKCLVLRVESAEARALNNTLGAMGATSDYDSYKPHVTLAYNIKQDIDPHTLPVPQFPLHFDELHVAPLDPLFVPDNSK
jgi:2'-5' RNA ligase